MNWAFQPLLPASASSVDTTLAASLTGSATLTAFMAETTGSTAPQTRAGSPRRTLGPRVYRVPLALYSTATAATFDAALTGTATLAADLTTAITAAASVSGTATVAADLTTSITAAASLSGIGTLTADLSTAITMAAAMTGSATVTADLTQPILLATDWTASATLTADLSTAVTMSAQMSGIATFTADLEAQDAAPVVGMVNRARTDALLQWRQQQAADGVEGEDGDDPAIASAGEPDPLTPLDPATAESVSHETGGIPTPVGYAPDVLPARAELVQALAAIGIDPGEVHDDDDVEDLLTLLTLGGAL